MSTDSRLAQIVDVDVTVLDLADRDRLTVRLVGEPVGEWLAITPEVGRVGSERAQLTGRWTVTHRASGLNAAASCSWLRFAAAEQYAREADALGAEVWGREDLTSRWFVSRAGAAARDALATAIYHADRLDAPAGHSQPEPAQPAEAA